jgi:hypothetical protein
MTSNRLIPSTQRKMEFQLSSSSAGINGDDAAIRDIRNKIFMGDNTVTIKSDGKYKALSEINDVTSLEEKIKEIRNNIFMGDNTISIEGLSQNDALIALENRVKEIRNKIFMGDNSVSIESDENILEKKVREIRNNSYMGDNSVSIENVDVNAVTVRDSKDEDVIVPSLFNKIKSVLSGNGLKGSMTKESLSKLGLNVLLAYGFVSNASYITCLILAWVTHGKNTGLSPLVAGQWKKFLVIYGSFFVANNILRPLRFSLSLTLTPLFDRLITTISKKTGFSRRNSTGVSVFLVNIVGSFTYLFLGLFLATSIAKVPLLP